MIADGYQYYRIKLHGLTEEQKHRILELSGVRRFLYNWGINYCESLKEDGKGVPNYNTFCKVLTQLRGSEQYSWLQKYNVTTERYALKDLINAYDKFFRKINRYPRFKSRKRNTIMCSIRDDRIRFKGENGRYAYIPGISKDMDDLIDCSNHRIPYGKYAHYKNARIKFDGVDYWLSISVALYEPFACEDQYIPPGDGIGVDVGLRTSAALSDGTMYDPPNQHRINILENRRDRIRSSIGKDITRRYNESVRTKTKYESIPKSKNEVKREEKWRKTCNRIRNIYNSHYHKISRDIANRKPKFVVLETLSVGKMEKDNHFLAPYIHRASLQYLISLIDYKCRDNGSKVIYAQFGFKSSQICSNCGHETNMGASKIYECPHCGLIIDRDLNAAINLRDYGIQNY